MQRNRKPDGSFYPRWLVQFRLPGGVRRRESSLLPICERCLAVDDAAESRASCACVRDARSWGKVRLEELALEWKAGRLETKQEPAVKPLTLAEVAAVYRERGPDEAGKNLQSLALVIEAGMGRHGEAIWKTRLDELAPDMWDEFAWCYQERERRGWTDRTKEVPADAWQQIRRAMPAHPDPDRECATTGNTSIISHMRKAKSVLGPESRDSYLKPLRDRFPDSLRRWWETKIKVRVPDGRFSLSAEVYEKMWNGLPALKQDDAQVWALIRLHWTTGLRPCESRAARLSWLEQDAAGTVLLVVKNRPEEGFTMKDSTTRQERPWPLPVDLVNILPQLADAETGSLLGCATEGQWDRVYRRASAWLREMGVEGSQTLYNLRKLVGTVKLATEGAEAMRDALGHSTVKTGLDFYAGAGGTIKPLGDEELSPAAVMGLRRVPFVLPVATTAVARQAA